MIAATANGEIEILREQEIDTDAEWKLDSASSEEAEKLINLARKGRHLLENVISPDGRYILI